MILHFPLVKHHLDHFQILLPFLFLKRMQLQELFYYKLIMIQFQSWKVISLDLKFDLFYPIFFFFLLFSNKLFFFIFKGSWTRIIRYLYIRRIRNNSLPMGIFQRKDWKRFSFIFLIYFCFLFFVFAIS